MFVADVKCSQATWQTVPNHIRISMNKLTRERAIRSGFQNTDILGPIWHLCKFIASDCLLLHFSQCNRKQQLAMQWHLFHWL